MSDKQSEPVEYKKARVLIDKVIEPQIGKVVEELNKTLKRYGLAAACTINWEFISLNEKEVPNGKSEETK